MANFFQLLLLSSLLWLSPNIESKTVDTKHPTYVSLGLINHNDATHTLDITFKIFTDDVQQAVRKYGNDESIYIGYDDEPAKADSLIGAYLNEKVHFSLNGKQPKMVYLGKEIELDVTWCYLQIKDVPNFETIKAHCTLLNELYPSQTTIMHVKNKGDEKTMMFKVGKEDDSIDFD